MAVTLVLWVNDFDKAVFFYTHQTELFTLDTDVDIGRGMRNALAFRCKEAPLRIQLHLATNPAMSALVDRQGGDYALLALPVEDCMRLYEALKRKGVQFTDEPVQLPYGCQATMIDPFGNKICLSQLY